MPFWKRKHKPAPPEAQAEIRKQQVQFQLETAWMRDKGLHSELSKEAKLAILNEIEEDLAKLAIPEPPPRFRTVEEADRWLEGHS